MRGYFYLLLKEIKLMLKNRSFYIWALFLPVLFLLIFSRIGKGDSTTKILLIDRVNNPITREFKEKLGKDFTLVSNEESTEKLPIIELSGDFLFKTKKDTRVKVVFPADFSRGKEIYIKIAVYRILAELTAKYKLGIHNPKTFVTLKKQEDKLLEIPWGIRHTLPAIILMFILFNVLTKGVEKFYSYKQEGLIERLSVLPSGVKGVFAYFILYQVLLAMLSVTVIFIAGVFFFGFSIQLNQLIYLYLIFLVFSFLVSSFSVFVFSFVKKKETAIGLGVLIANVLCAMGGLWWPMEIMPPFLRKIGLMLPTGLTMNIIDGIIYYQLPFTEIITQLSVLTAFSIVLFFISSFLFLGADKSG